MITEILSMRKIMRGRMLSSKHPHALFVIIFVAACFSVFCPAHAQAAVPLLSYNALLEAIDPTDPQHATALDYFDQITKPVQEIDVGPGANTGKPVSGGLDKGGQNLINQIIRGLGGTAPATWSGPLPANSALNQPSASGRALAISLIKKIVAGDENALKTFQAMIVAHSFFAPLGFTPAYIVGPGQVALTGENVGVETLAFLSAGSLIFSATTNVPLETLALAMDTYNANAPDNNDAQKILSVVFTYLPNCSANPPYPSNCSTADTSGALYDLLSQILPAAQTIDPSISITPIGDVIRAAIAGNVTAQLIVGKALNDFLAQGKNPASPVTSCDSGKPPKCTCSANCANNLYLGPLAIAYLQYAVVGLPGAAPPKPGVNTPPPPGVISVSPLLQTDPGGNILGAGLHKIPSTGDNTAAVVCNWAAEDVTLQFKDGTNTDNAGAEFGTDPCWLRDPISAVATQTLLGNKMLDANGMEIPAFTRNTLKLDFAQKFKAGQQWAGYFPTWVSEQWIPSLKKMTAEWTAAMINQTRMIGSAIDAIEASKTATAIQKHQLEVKHGATPSELACQSASPTHGIAHAESVSHAMSSALTHTMQIQAGKGIIGP